MKKKQRLKGTRRQHQIQRFNAKSETQSSIGKEPTKEPQEPKPKPNGTKPTPYGPNIAPNFTIEAQKQTIRHRSHTEPVKRRAKPTNAGTRETCPCCCSIGQYDHPSTATASSPQAKNHHKHKIAKPIDNIGQAGDQPIDNIGQPKQQNKKG